MPTRYDRIPARIESPRDNNADVVHSQGVLERKIPTVDDSKLRRNQKQLKRRGSGSYDIIDSDEEDFRNDQHHQLVENGENGNPKRSPLHNPRSYGSDAEDRDDEFPLDGPTFPTSPRAVYPTFSNSFDLDDDDDDDILEANLKRYNLDFTTTDKGASLGENNDSFVREASSNIFSRAAKYLWYSFQSVRQQARQRRAQLLLQQTERNWKQSLKICILTNCDATDSGILLVAATMIIWILVLVFIKDLSFRRIWIILGILCFLIRVGTRPLYHCCLRQRHKRLLQREREQQHGEDQFHSSHSDGTLELHAIRGGGNHANRLAATSVGSDPTIAAI